jgi:hypothetical protein
MQSDGGIRIDAGIGLAPKVRQTSVAATPLAPIKPPPHGMLPIGFAQSNAHSLGNASGNANTSQTPRRVISVYSNALAELDRRDLERARRESSALLPQSC